MNLQSMHFSYYALPPASAALLRRDFVEFLYDRLTPNARSRRRFPWLGPTAHHSPSVESPSGAVRLHTRTGGESLDWRGCSAIDRQYFR